MTPPDEGPRFEDIAGIRFYQELVGAINPVNVTLAQNVGTAYMSRNITRVKTLLAEFLEENPGAFEKSPRLTPNVKAFIDAIVAEKNISVQTEAVGGAAEEAIARV